MVATTTAAAAGRGSMRAGSVAGMRLAAAGREGLAHQLQRDMTDAETLQPLTRIEGRARVLAAAWLGKTRLIDNMPVEA